MSTGGAPRVLPSDEESVRYRLAYNEAQRALQTQQADLAALQARAGTLLSSGAIATTFLGGLRGLSLFRAFAAPTQPGAIVSAGLPIWMLVLILSAFAVLVGTIAPG